MTASNWLLKGWAIPRKLFCRLFFQAFSQTSFGTTVNSFRTLLDDDMFLTNNFRKLFVSGKWRRHFKTEFSTSFSYKPVVLHLAKKIINSLLQESSLALLLEQTPILAGLLQSNVLSVILPLTYASQALKKRNLTLKKLLQLRSFWLSFFPIKKPTSANSWTWLSDQSMLPMCESCDRKFQARRFPFLCSFETKSGAHKSPCLENKLKNGFTCGSLSPVDVFSPTSRGKRTQVDSHE